ncbi:hypothetical protein RW1_041_00540 [Rhodococcus wratislaviensis NBRC 100605]|uniref:Uncharacterized protein n=1 Tax=Rhodococcus wratislaviensis NBRC 100605 TaxID=1219028 RepID=X0PW65_RHOWR|nr:hypothetical protein RW1_041_00540 [Rhodococcus wratislaviensis NBRC 100605]
MADWRHCPPTVTTHRRSYCGVNTTTRRTDPISADEQRGFWAGDTARLQTQATTGILDQTATRRRNFAVILGGTFRPLTSRKRVLVLSAHGLRLRQVRRATSEIDMPPP